MDPEKPVEVVIGVISDTHGLVRRSALAALEGCDRILHAGDVGGPDVLEALSRVAPVVAVRGNMDRGGWAQKLSRVKVVEIAGRWFCILHELDRLDLDAAASGFAAVISGHTHMPASGESRGVVYLNPGSAGPVRADRPVSLARITVNSAGLSVEIIRLSPSDHPE